MNAPILALASPIIIAILIIAAVVMFGAERLPKLARNLGKVKSEFHAGQAESATDSTHPADH
jgi:Sec-independent protein translocase protein TatA